MRFLAFFPLILLTLVITGNKPPEQPIVQTHEVYELANIVLAHSFINIPTFTF